MRVFALSDIHVDYDVNRIWLANLSAFDYKDDLLILAGDVTDSLLLLERCLKSLTSRFKKVLYVPGNHELWVIRDAVDRHSIEKFREVCAVVDNAHASMQPYHCESLSIVPLLSWYDYTFGEPDSELLANWMDFRACRWPSDFGEKEITSYFLQANESVLGIRNHTVISFSHFLPRIDVMPHYIPPSKRYLYPVLGTARLESQIRRLNSHVHVYGHSHVNQKIVINDTLYINNAFGYPGETMIAAKQLLCIHDTSIDRSLLRA